MIPLMTRRSSTLGLPRVSLGRCGLSRANCSSLSQKESRSINGLPSETLNHDAPRFGNQFMGPEPSMVQNTFVARPDLEDIVWQVLANSGSISERTSPGEARTRPDPLRVRGANGEGVRCA